MKQTIDPARIRKLAKDVGIENAKQLAQRLSVSERTAFRLWSGKGDHRPRKPTPEECARIFGVDVAVVTGAAPMPQGQSNDRPAEDLVLQLTTLKAVVGTAAANALALNAIRYRVSIKTQVELAALLFHVMAQRSLRHRRETLHAIYQDLDRLNALGEARAPHLPAPGHPRGEFDEGLSAETRSIEAEDIFAGASDFFGLDTSTREPERRNPFAEEIRRVAAGLPDINEQQIDVTKDGVNYAINGPQAISLADGDEELAEAILDGTIKLQGLTWKLVGEDRTQERVAELRRRLHDYWAEFQRRFGTFGAGDVELPL